MSSDKSRTRSTGRARRVLAKRLASLRSDQRGAVIVIVAASMLAFLGMLGLALDVGGWYQTERHAQSTADAAALAAANAMAGGATTTAAQTVATTYVTSNDSSLPASTVTFDTTNSKVTVRVSTTARVFFSKALGVTSPSVGATAVASWTAGAVPYSLFAGNSACGTGAGITFESAGGGTSNVTGIHSNGQLVNNANSNATFTGTISSTSASGTTVTPAQAACSSSTWNSKNTTVTSSGSAVLPFPVIYTQPTGAGCTHSASSFTSSQITGPGVYCATGANILCADGLSNGPGSIYLNQVQTGVELVAPCVVLGGSAGSSSPPSGQPLIYGTGSGTTTSVWIDDNNSTIAGTIYVPNGTVEFTQNNDVATFVEAANIIIDKNNFTITGTGPMMTPGSDTLVG